MNDIDLICIAVAQAIEESKPEVSVEAMVNQILLLGDGRPELIAKAISDLSRVLNDDPNREVGLRSVIRPDTAWSSSVWAGRLGMGDLRARARGLAQGLSFATKARTSDLPHLTVAS